MTVTCGCSCSTDAGQNAETGPSTAARTAGAVRDQDEMPCITDGSEPLRDHMMRYVGWVCEEPCIVGAGPLGQGLHSGARCKRGGGLVETDVSVQADAEDLHVDGTVFGDGSVVTPGSVTGIRGPAVGAEHSRIVDVEVIHEFRADGVRVGLRLIGRETYILVEKIRAHRRERHSRFSMPLDQLSIRVQR